MGQVGGVGINHSVWHTRPHVIYITHMARVIHAWKINKGTVATDSSSMFSMLLGSYIGYSV